MQPGKDSLYLTLQNEGPGLLPYQIAVDKLRYLQVNGASGGTLKEGEGKSLELRVRSDAPHEFGEDLVVRTENGPRLNWHQTVSWRDNPTTLNVKKVQPGYLECSNHVLYFPENHPWQSLYLHNPGDTEIVTEMQAPTGYWLVLGEPGETEPNLDTLNRSISLQLAAYSPPRRLWIHRESTAASAPALFTPSHLRHKIELVPISHRAFGGYAYNAIVGIDFGTVNSSVRIRRIRYEETGPAGTILPEEVFTVPQKQPRFPSLLYMPFDPMDTPLIGLEAEPYMGRESGMVVEGIKSLVRLGIEPFTKEVERYGPRFTVRSLLKTYLTLLKGEIDKVFQANGWQDQGDVLYVFTLPVLDAGKEYQNQEARMRQAAVGAGFPDDDSTLWFLEEPASAALFAVRRASEIFGAETPQELIVLDAGGGTTDVCRGSIYINEQGQWRFRPIQTFSLETEPSEVREHYLKAMYSEEFIQSPLQQDTQTAGRLIDFSLANLSEGGGGKPARLSEKPWNRLYTGQIRRIEEQAVREYLYGISLLKERLCQKTTEEVNLAQGQTYQTFFHKRLNLAVPPRLENRDPVAMGELFPQGSAIFSYRDDIVPLVRSMWSQKGMGPRLQAEVGGATGAVVLTVGGTSSIVEFRDQSQYWSNLTVKDVGPDARQLAVVEGAVLAWDAQAKDVLGRSFRLVVKHPHLPARTDIFLAAHQSVRSARPLTRPYHLVAHEQLETVIEAESDGQWRVVAQEVYKAYHPMQLSVWIGPTDKGLVAEWRFGQNVQAFWELRT